MSSVQIDMLRFNSNSKSPSLNKHQSSISNHHQQQFKRTANSSKMQSSVPPSTQQLRKVIRSLETMVKQQKQKRKQVQSNLLAYRERAIHKENQFKKILQRMGYLETSGNSPAVEEIYKSILQNFDQSNQQALQLLQKKYEQNCNFMNRRCTQIIQKTQQQLRNVKKLSEQDFEKIKRQIEDVLFLAKYLEQQNSSFKKKLSALQFRNKILFQERACILQDLALTKKKIVKLTRQLNKEDTKSTDKRSQNSRIRDQTHILGFAKDVKKFQTMQIDKLIANQKQGILQSNNVKVWIHENRLPQKPSLHDTTAPNTIKTINVKPSNDRNSITRGSKRFIGRKEPIYTSDFGDKISVASSMERQQTINQQMGNIFFNPSLLKASSKETSKNPRNQRQYKKSSSICINSRQPSSTIAGKAPINQYQQTIKHLKTSLEREKKRRIQLGNIVSKLQSQNEDINNTIQDCLRKSSKNRNLQANGVESLIKSEKLFQVIRDIKKRLAMVQHPSINCGWGDQDLLVLNELEKQINPDREIKQSKSGSYSINGQNQSQGLRQTYTREILGQ